MINLLQQLEAATHQAYEGKTLALVHEDHKNTFKGGKPLPFTKIEKVRCVGLPRISTASRLSA